MHSPQPSRQKLRVVVTRRLPEAVETRMKELFDVVLRDDDAKMSRDDLAAAMRGADVLVPTVTDQISEVASESLRTIRVSTAPAA